MIEDREINELLLEALRYCHKLLVDMGHGSLAGPLLAEEAIARAEGRQ